jgi:endonuclease YncB( thermonuclease family)
VRKVLALALLIALVVVGYAAVRGGWLTATQDPTGSGAPEPVGIPVGATEAVVEYVHDGDTLFLDDGRKVRLLGINTPEIGEHQEC